MHAIISCPAMSYCTCLLTPQERQHGEAQITTPRLLVCTHTSRAEWDHTDKVWEHGHALLERCTISCRRGTCLFVHPKNILPEGTAICLGIAEGCDAAAQRNGAQCLDQPVKTYFDVACADTPHGAKYACRPVKPPLELVTTS